jgi:hypothetical protein
MASKSTIRVFITGIMMLRCRVGVRGENNAPTLLKGKVEAPDYD